MALLLSVRPYPAFLILAALVACGGSEGGGGPAPGGEPNSVTIVAGDNESARYGAALDVPPTLVVRNAQGPVAGVFVRFTVTGGGGSVADETVQTGANGQASAGRWTLGPTPGLNALTAVTGGVTVTFHATAYPGPPSVAAITAGNGQTWVEQSQVPVPPALLITDGQFPVPGTTVVFTVTAGGGSVIGTGAVTDSNGIARVGWRLGSTAINTLTATVPMTTIAPVAFSATAEPLIVSAVNKIDGDNQYGFAGNFATRLPTVLVLNQFGLPTEGVPVTMTVGGGGAIGATSVTTGLNGLASPPWWRFGAAGAQSVTATAGVAPAAVFYAFPSAVPPSQFRINVIVPPGAPALTPAVQAAFNDAKARWEQLIVGGLTPVILSGSNVIGPFSINTGLPDVGTIPCIPLVSNTTIQDINIYAYVRPIDGTAGSNILGLATPVYVRNGTNLPLAGCMVFDSENMDEMATSGVLDEVILHEMAHVFGFGTLWDQAGRLAGACPASTTPSFTGASSRQAFVAALAGAAFTNPIVPVEGEGACNDGTRDGHWSESVFGNEIMTGFIDAGSNPLSAVTTASLRDMGYVVNDAASDAYTVPPTTTALRIGRQAGRMRELPARTPIIVVDPRGSVTRIIDR